MCVCKNEHICVVSLLVHFGTLHCVLIYLYRKQKQKNRFKHREICQQVAEVKRTTIQGFKCK